jgi:glycosyltransferase involved in cell wall biosynthesis
MVEDTKVALINDQHIFSGVYTETYRMFLNLKRHGIKCNFYQLLLSAKGFSPTGDVKVRYGYLSKFESNSKFLYNSKLALNFLTGRNWRQFKDVDGRVVILSGPSLLPLTSYFKTTIVEGHDLYFSYDGHKSGVLGAYMQRMYRQFKNATHIIANSEFTKREFIAILGIDPENISVVYPSFDEFPVFMARNEIRSKLNVDIDSILLLSVGGDNRNKNIETIVRLMKFLPNNYILIRVGRNYNVSKLIKELDLEKRIIKLGNIDESLLAQLYSGTDIFLFPSIFEGFGSPVVEAMSFGLPVIASSMAALPEVVGGAGFLCDPFDIDCWKDKILSLATDEHLYNLAKEKGINRAHYFSAENQYLSLMKVLGKLI